MADESNNTVEENGKASPDVIIEQEENEESK